MTIEEIRKFETEFDDSIKGKSHESVLRSYQALKKVVEMIKRGDSKETMLEVIDLMGYAYYA